MERGEEDDTPKADLDPNLTFHATDDINKDIGKKKFTKKKKKPKKNIH